MKAGEGILHAQMRLFTVIFLILVAFVHQHAMATSLDDRVISEIQFEGLDRVSEQRVLNIIQSVVGDPYRADAVQGDVHTLTHLGEFNYITADVVLQEDGTVHLIYSFREQQIITQVSVVGNTMIGDRMLLDSIPVMEGLGRDQDMIDRGKRAIMDLYKEEGNYLVEVQPEIIVYGKDVDEFTGLRLDESIVLIYKVMEGPRVRVNSISFAGNKAFTGDELMSEIDTNISIPFFRRGELNEQVLEADKLSLKRFYVNRGYRDVRVSYLDPLSPNDKEAAVVFSIEEGPQYIISGISVEFRTTGQLEPVFTEEQLKGIIDVQEGDTYRQGDVSKSVRSINSAYGVLGRIVNVDPQQEAVNRARKNLFGGGGTLSQDVASAVPYHAKPGASVEILFIIDEGLPQKVGLVEIMGNTVTKDNVIRRLIGLTPGQPFNVEEAARSKERIKQTGLFRPATVSMTLQPEDPNNPGYQDLLVEVEEQRTGTVSFGVIAGSDSGLLGNISIDQGNFDVADVPESWDEFLHGKSFIGAGQKFRMAFQPGDEIFNYEISLTDPRFLDTDYSIGGSGGWAQRLYEDYTQETLYGKVQVGRKFGDVWYGSVRFDTNNIKLIDIDDNVPVEIYDDRGPSTVQSIGATVSRTTLFPFVRPYEGSRTRINLDFFGVPGGDFTFTKSELNYTTYFAMDRDFLERTTTLRIDGKLGHIFGGTSPTYKRFYLGGRSLRGFDFRTISPKGTPRVAGGATDAPIGGDLDVLPWRSV